jgi:hypothetical protein
MNSNQYDPKQMKLIQDKFPNKNIELNFSNSTFWTIVLFSIRSTSTTRLEIFLYYMQADEFCWNAKLLLKTSNFGAMSIRHV